MKLKGLFLGLCIFSSSCIFDSQALCPNSNNPDDVTFYLYNDAKNYSMEVGKTLDVHDLDALNNVEFKPGVKTVLVIHGFGQKLCSWVPQEVKEWYFRKNVPVNFIAVDWGKLAGVTCDPEDAASFPWPVKNMKVVGERVAFLIFLLVTVQQIPLDRIHCVGFSLGAHVCGFTGQGVKSLLHEPMGRLTALDPTDCFSYHGRHVSKYDSCYTTVIYTSKGVQPNPEAVGHNIFYVNNCGLAPQPVCIESGNIRWIAKNNDAIQFYSTCSHDLAVHCFLQSIGEGHLCACRNFSQMLINDKCSCTDPKNANFSENARPRYWKYYQK